MCLAKNGDMCAENQNIHVYLYYLAKYYANMSDGLLDRAGAEQLLEEDIVQRPLDTSLESIVQIPTWREVLVDMVYQNEIDPWNVDVAQVANKYLQTIRGMQMEDLRVPANLILASSILLRFKSDMVSLEEAPVQSQLDEFIDVDESQPISALELNWRIAPKGRMTLDDLVEAVEEVMSNAKQHDERVSKREQVYIEPAKNIHITMSQFKIEDEVEKLYKKIGQLVDSQNLVTFSNIVDKKDRTKVIFTFLPLLFLANEGRVVLSQEPFFGEIFIRFVQPKRD